VPLAVIAILLTLRATPQLEPDPDASRDLDLPGVVTFALAVAAVLSSLYPVTTVILAGVVLHERITRVHALGIALAVAAIACIAAGSGA